MNKQQRKQVQEIINSLQPWSESEHVKKHGAEEAKGYIDSAAEDFTAIADEEREKFDNMPEGLQQSEKGQDIESAADALESAASMLSGIDFDNKEEGWEDVVADAVTDAINEAEIF